MYNNRYQGLECTHYTDLRKLLVTAEWINHKVNSWNMQHTHDPFMASSAVFAR